MLELNPHLLRRQHINPAEEELILTLHRMRQELFDFASTLEPTDTQDRPVLKQLPAILEPIEYAMQRAWKFEESKAFHTWWYRMPNCHCPRMDNDDMQGVEQSVINLSCPIHGKEM